MLYSSASKGSDHFKRRRSASDPPGASLQEERGPGESGHPDVHAREAGRALQEQESGQTFQKVQRETRPQAKGESTELNPR